MRTTPAIPLGTEIGNNADFIWCGTTSFQDFSRHIFISHRQFQLYGKQLHAARQRDYVPEYVWP